MTKIFLIISVFLLIICLLYLLNSPIKNKYDRKVLLFLSDGADWKIVNLLIEQEKLSAFKEMKESGSYGYLISPYSFSPVSWTEIATGKTLDKHGIDDWNKINPGGGQRIINSNDVRSKRIWNILNEYNISTGVVNWLATWPPEKVNGFMVSDWLAQNENVTYPDYLKIKFKIPDDEMDKVSYLFENLSENINFFAAGEHKTDILSHNLWKFVEPNEFGIENETQIKIYSNVLFNAYIDIDNFIKKIDDSWTIFAVSDSGFKAVPYLSYKTNINPLIDELNISSKISWCPVPYNTSIIEIPFANKSMVVYLSLFCIIDNNIDINKTINLLSEVKYTKTKQKFFDKIEYDPKIYRIVITVNLYKDNFEKEIIREDNTVDASILLDLPYNKTFELWVGPEKTGDHPPRTNGIIIVKGPMIKRNFEIKNATVYDITPTILYLYDIPIPKDIDGRVLTEIIDPRYLILHPIKYSNESSQWEKTEKEIKINQTLVQNIYEKLRDLGYVR